jgi:hypothetical protein
MLYIYFHHNQSQSYMYTPDPPERALDTNPESRIFFLGTWYCILLNQKVKSIQKQWETSIEQ